MENDIEIDNAQTLLTQAGELKQISQNIYNIKDQLVSNIKQISDAWQSDTEDREAYLSGINKNLTKIDALCKATHSLSDELTDHAEKIIRVSSSK